MVSIPLFGSTAPPTVRRPVFKVRFGNAPGSEWLNTVISMTVEVGLGPSVDHVEVVLSRDAQAPSVSVGDSGSISLGYEDDAAVLVFTGKIDSVRHDTEGTVRITATNGGAILARLRVNQSYVQQKAADIVSDLVGQTDANTATLEDGVELPFYVIDEHQTAYQHVAVLAKKSGFLSYFSPEGALNFLPYTSEQLVQTFIYGQNILSLQITESAPVIERITAIGEGAAGGHGKEAWSWLIKDSTSVTANAGEGKPSRQIQDASLRSAEAVQSLADGSVQTSSLLQYLGKIFVPGAPTVSVGSTIEIAEAPQDVLNGQCLVRGVRHIYSKREGFTTLVEFCKTDSGGLGSLGGFL